MTGTPERDRVQAQAAELIGNLRAQTGPGARCKNGARVRIRAQFSTAPGAYVLALAHELLAVDDCRWFGYCLARYHAAAFQSLDDAQIEAFGQECAGDTPRTLAICGMLATDADPYVSDALYAALRALARHDPPGVRAFVNAHAELPDTMRRHILDAV